MKKHSPRFAKMANRIVLLSICAGTLAACGGGGSDSTTAAPTSYWTMDSHTYVDGGVSSQSTGAIGGKPLTVVAVSTATTDGGDQSNGTYSGSALTFSFLGTSAGTYNIVPSKAALVAADSATNPILVESNIGIAVTTGSSLYTATAGQVVVTFDATGKAHFATVAPLATTKTLDVLGGVVGSPPAMTLTIHDAT
jgi:hypothetical protein